MQSPVSFKMNSVFTLSSIVLLTLISVSVRAQTADGSSSVPPTTLPQAQKAALANPPDLRASASSTSLQVVSAPAPMAAVQSPTLAPVLAQTASPVSPEIANGVSLVPVKVVYVSENQPIQIVDQNGRLIEVIYLKKRQ